MEKESPIPGLKVAGAKDLQEILPMQAAMDYNWIAYLNQRVIESIRMGWNRRVTHLKFVPDLDRGVVYILPCQSGEYGAFKLNYSAPETGAEVSLYIPLLRFELEREEGRLRIFPVELREPVKGQTYMALNVTESKSVPGKGRGSKANPGTEAAASSEA